MNPTTPAELAAALVGLADLPPIERARAAGALIGPAQMMLSRIRGEAIHEATRLATHQQVADALGVTPYAINGTITKYLRTLRKAAQ